MKKRGISPVIAVVLLMMITIVAAGIIIAFVVPFVRDNLGDSGECFDVLGDLNFDDTPYNCVNSTYLGEGRTGFSVRVDNDKITGFKVSLLKQGSSNAFDITNESSYGNIGMLLGSFGQALEVPQRGGVRTYVANGTFEKVEIFPILNSGAKCELADEINLNECDGANIHSDLTNY